MIRLRRFWNKKKQVLILGLSALIGFSISMYCKEESCFLLALKIYAGISMFIIVIGVLFIIRKKRILYEANK